MRREGKKREEGIASERSGRGRRAGGRGWREGKEGKVWGDAEGGEGVRKPSQERLGINEGGKSEEGLSYGRRNGLKGGSLLRGGK